MPTPPPPSHRSSSRPSAPGRPTSAPERGATSRFAPGRGATGAPATIAALAVLAATTITSVGHADSRHDVDAETGYRMERYRAPVPDSVPGGTTLDTGAVRARIAEGTLVPIDVFPPKGLGSDPFDGTWVISEGHETLAEATWLPEVGQGHLTAEHEDYFRRNLVRLTDDDPATPIVFLCTADCWQSWNASRRAALWGYTAVHWYPLGTDGWAEEGGELVPARPVNFLDDSLPDTAPGHDPDERP